MNLNSAQRQPVRSRTPLVRKTIPVYSDAARHALTLPVSFLPSFLSLPYLVAILVRAAERQELSDELVCVGDAVVSLSLRQDLLPSSRDAGHLYLWHRIKIR